MNTSMEEGWEEKTQSLSRSERMSKQRLPLNGIISQVQHA